MLVSIVICDKSVFVSHRCLDFQLQTLFSLAAQPHDCVNSSPSNQNRYVSQEGFLTGQMKCKYAVKYYNKIRKPKADVSWLKSALFYFELTQLTQGDHVHLCGCLARDQFIPFDRKS